MALRYLRENLKSFTWLIWLVAFGVFIVVFFDWGGYSQRQLTERDAAATVGSEQISYGEFQREYRRMEANFRQTFGERYNDDLAKQFNLPKRALDQLIDRRILLMEAREVGLEVSDGEVRDAILAQPDFKDATGKFIGSDEYSRLLRANRLTVDDFEASVRKDVLLQKLNAILAETMYVSDRAVEKAYRDQTERAKIRYFELESSEFSDVTAETAELETYFADHQEDYELPEQRVVDYLLVDTVKLRREIEIPEQQIRAYYDDNPDEFTREEQVRARHILFKVTPDRPDAQAQADLEAVRRRVEAGEDFAQLAQDLSEDEGSASRGGSLGFFGRGQMIPAFEEAAFGAEVGALVGPIKTDFGYHLIEVQDHRQGGLQEFDQVQAVVRSRLIGQRVEEIATAKAEDVAQRLDLMTAGEGEDPMAVLAEEEGLVFQTTEPFGRDDTVTGIGRAPAFTSSAFGLEEGGVSETIKIPRGWVILRHKETLSEWLPELAEVEDQVRQAVEQEKRSTLALKRLQEAAASLGTGSDFDVVAANLGLEIQESEEFGRFGSIPGLAASREVIDAALALEQGQSGDPIATDGGAVLFEVTERKTFDAAEFEEAKESTRVGQEGQQLNQLMASLIEIRRRDLTPTYDPQVFANFGIELPGSDTPGT